MKKVLLLLAVAFTVGATAQSSIQIKNIATGLVLSPNATVYVASLPYDMVSHDFDIKNISNATKSYDVMRYDKVIHRLSPTDSASAHFCFAGQCYGKGTRLSGSALTLTASQSASQVSGPNQILTVELEETTSPTLVGLSIVKYTIFNSASVSDSIQFTMIYNDPIWVGLKGFEKELSSVDVVPNPSSGAASIKFVSGKSFDSKVSVFNSLGQLVSEREVSIIEGKNKIALETENLSSGIYIVSIKTGNKAITKKLIINN